MSDAATEPMELAFTYFEAPEAEMMALLPGRLECSICGRLGRCFDLSRSLESTRKGPGCAACLRNGMFGFFHVTEVGYLDENGLTFYGEPTSIAPRLFIAGSDGVAAQLMGVNAVPPAANSALARPSDDRIAELRCTPSFPTWNEVEWPVHCRDFMVYLGPWDPGNVVSLAARLKLSPAECFRLLAGTEHAPTWTGQDEWAITFHVFRCRACHGHSGTMDHT